MSKSPITCHVLDASQGKPASGVRVSLDVVSLKEDEGLVVASEMPKTLASGVTNNDGRCADLLDPSTKLSPGTYRMTFHTGPYFAASGTDAFYPLVEITFNYGNPEQHYHIPLLISPFSYTTYRGS